MQFLRSVSEALLATLFPLACEICDQLVELKANGVACQACWDDFTPLSLTNICQRCGYPRSNITVTCLDCTHCTKLQISCARAIGYYEGALKANILHLKKYPTLCAKVLDLLEYTLLNNEKLATNDLMIPVPLHPSRQAKRGFNQAEIIAQNLSLKVKIPLDLGSLVRVKPTLKHRLGMDAKDREKSVKNAFEVTRKRLIKERKILLIDDLFTTGSTLSACAETLLTAGALEVNALTLARVRDLKG